MPAKQLRPCKTRGCAGLTRGAFCEKCHGTTAPRATAAARGYGAHWQRLRRVYLAEFPLCANPFGLHRGPVVATDVDHKTPRARGGSDDYENLQALCHSCHSAKTRREQLAGSG